MFVLFDQGTPVPIRPFLKEHTVQTTAQRGWDKLKNGELLKAAEDAGFDVLVTPDKNIRYQQNLKVRTIALVVLGNPQWPILRLHVERVVAAVKRGEAGQLHGSRNTRTLINWPQKGAAALFLVLLFSHSGRQVSSRAKTSNPFIESVGAWFDVLPARSTLGCRQGNSRV
jgi:hypothetical protein